MAHYGKSSSYRYGGGSYSHHNPLVTNIGRIHTPLRYASLLSTISESPASLNHHLSSGIMSGRHKVNSYSQYQANHIRRDHSAIQLQCHSLKTNAALQNYFEKREKSAGELLMEKFSIKDKYQVLSKTMPHTSKTQLLSRGLRDTIQRRMTRKLMKKRLSSDIQLSSGIPKHESAISQVQAQLLDNLVAEEQAKIDKANNSLSRAKNTLEENLLTSCEFNQVDNKHFFSSEVDDNLLEDNNHNNNNKKTITILNLETKIEKNLENLKNDSKFSPLHILVQSRSNHQTDELSNDHSHNSSYVLIEKKSTSKTHLYKLQSTHTQHQNTTNIETSQLKGNFCCSEDIDTCSKDIIERNIEVKSGRGSNNQQGIQAQYDPPFEKLIQAQPKNRQEELTSLIVSKNSRNPVKDCSRQLNVDKCQKSAYKICKFPLQDINQMNSDEMEGISTNRQFLLQPKTSNIKDNGDSEVVITVNKKNNNHHEPNSIADSMSVSSKKKMNAEPNESSKLQKIFEYGNILEKESTFDANKDDSRNDLNNHTQHSIEELQCHTWMTLTNSEQVTNVLALEKSVSNRLEKSIHLEKNPSRLENFNSFSGQSSEVVSENKLSKCDTVSVTGNENLHTLSSSEIQAAQKKSEFLVDDKKFKSISSSSNNAEMKDEKVFSKNSDEHFNSSIKRNIMLTSTSKSGTTDINYDFDVKLEIDCVDVNENNERNKLSDFQIEEMIEKNKTLSIKRDVEEKPTKNLKMKRSNTKKIKKSTSVKTNQKSLTKNVIDKKFNEVTVPPLEILEESQFLTQFVNKGIETANYGLDTQISNNQESNNKTSFRDNTLLIEFRDRQGNFNSSNERIVEYSDIAIDKNSKNFSNSNQTAKQNKTSRSQKKSTPKSSKQNTLIQKNITADKLKEKNVLVPKNRPLDLIKMFYITPVSLLTATPRDLSTVRRAKVKKKKHVGCSSSTNHNSTESDGSTQSIAEIEHERRDSPISKGRPNEKSSSERSNDSSLDGSPTLPNSSQMLDNQHTLDSHVCNKRFVPPATVLPKFKKYVKNDFTFLKILGKGSFGKVLLAELNDTDFVYAVKCLKKNVVSEDDDIESILIERKVLTLATRHPYLCHLFCTFQTESHLFFVMEYLNGGDLMFHIQMSGRFPEFRAKFYAAEIWCGLNFLHKKGIVYRDLKLDNVLLDFEGHIRIADFGMCKLQIYLDKTADNFCGTPDYMAPEIINGTKYNQSVDWWSFGVLLYEMLTAQSPFSGCDEDELFWSICNERPSIPKYLSQDSIDILLCLLEKDAGKRLLGHEVQNHPFFSNIQWIRLEKRQLQPPFRPTLDHTLDTKYFDEAFTTEKLRLTQTFDEDLTLINQEYFRGFSYTNPNATN